MSDWGSAEKDLEKGDQCKQLTIHGSDGLRNLRVQVLSPPAHMHEHQTHYPHTTHTRDPPQKTLCIQHTLTCTYTSHAHIYTTQGNLPQYTHTHVHTCTCDLP